MKKILLIQLAFSERKEKDLQVNLKLKIYKLMLLPIFNFFPNIVQLQYLYIFKFDKHSILNIQNSILNVCNLETIINYYINCKFTI